MVMPSSTTGRGRLLPKKPKTPLHEREIVYTVKEILQVLEEYGLRPHNYYQRYRRKEPLYAPTTKAFIRNWIKRVGYPIGRGKVQRYPERRKIIREMRKAGYTFQAIGDKLGMPRSNVYRTYNADRKQRLLETSREKPNIVHLGHRVSRTSSRLRTNPDDNCKTVEEKPHHIYVGKG